jgi:hypothetical protein
VTRDLFTWVGWDDECEPPEPGKRWLTIRDPDGEEFAIIVQRGKLPVGAEFHPEDYVFDEGQAIVLEGHAQMIVDALSAVVR